MYIFIQMINNNNKGYTMNLQELLRVRFEGVSEYLYSQGKAYNSKGRLWVTPYGTFSTLQEVEQITGDYRKTILRRFYSTKSKFDDWYIIDCDSELFNVEKCQGCDTIDDMIFLEDEKNWLHRVYHRHLGAITDDTMFEYLHSGVLYKVSLKDWQSGVRPHKQED